jgi:hypothetical protein
MTTRIAEEDKKPTESKIQGAFEGHRTALKQAITAVRQANERGLAIVRPALSRLLETIVDCGINDRAITLDVSELGRDENGDSLIGTTYVTPDGILREVYRVRNNIPQKLTATRLSPTDFVSGLSTVEIVVDFTQIIEEYLRSSKGTEAFSAYR